MHKHLSSYNMKSVYLVAWCNPYLELSNLLYKLWGSGCSLNVKCVACC